MATIQQLKTQIENANALGRTNLANKGVALPETATTYEIMQGIGDVSSGGSNISVEYIESTGTQYIDTGYIANQNTRIECKYKIVGNKGNYDNLFGDLTNIMYSHIYNNEYNNGYQFARWGGKDISWGNVVLSSDITTLELANGTFTFTENGVRTTKTVNENAEFTSQYSLLLFCNRYHANVSIYDSATLSKARLYYFKIYEGETLVRDFVPAMDNNGAICLYDNVTKAYFYNQGTGEFEGSFIEKVGIEPLDHTVTFTVDGQPYEIVSVKAGNSVNPPATEPTKDDYRFSGWELNSEKVKFPYVPTENTDLIASFSQGMPSDYVLYVPLRQESATAETGQVLSVVGSGLTYGVVDGVECAMFNSTSEIGVSVNSDWFVKGKPFTISMWAKADSVASDSYGPAFFGFNNSFKYYQCQNVSNVHNVPAFYIGGVWGAAGNTYRMTSWVHICLVYDGSQISMYSNGVSGDKYAVSSNFSTTNTLYLGGNGSGDRFANGKMSAFRVYDRALTESEILILSQEFTPTDR